jgi:DNA polymerase-3 subunit delta'
MLLQGPHGLGKHLFATAFCHALLCERRSASGACGECKACRLLSANNHPDFLLITLEEKAQQIKVDQIRDLVSVLSKTPQIGNLHCVVIDPAESMNINAVNALLKVLEEPPGEAIIVLISAYPTRLPATIRSRCQHHRFTVPKLSLAREWLIEGGVNDPANSLKLARGAPLRAQQLQANQGLQSRQCLRDQLQGVLTQRISVVEAGRALAELPGLEIIDTMLDWLYHKALSDSGFHDSAYLSPELGQQPEDLPEGLKQVHKPLDLFKFYDKLQTTKALLISSANPNKALLWEECLLDWQAYAKLPSQSPA